MIFSSIIIFIFYKIIQQSEQLCRLRDEHSNTNARLNYHDIIKASEIVLPKDIHNCINYGQLHLQKAMKNGFILSETLLDK